MYASEMFVLWAGEHEWSPLRIIVCPCHAAAYLLLWVSKHLRCWKVEIATKIKGQFTYPYSSKVSTLWTRAERALTMEERLRNSSIIQEGEHTPLVPTISISRVTIDLFLLPARVPGNLQCIADGTMYALVNHDLCMALPMTATQRSYFLLYAHNSKMTFRKPCKKSSSLKFISLQMFLGRVCWSL